MRKNRVANKIASKISHVGEFRDSLLDLYVDVQNRDVDLAEAIVMNNTAGKVIKLLNVELNYYAAANRLVKSKFIEG